MRLFAWVLEFSLVPRQTKKHPKSARSSDFGCKVNVGGGGMETSTRKKN